jgi:serine/threonine protein kinase
VEKYRWQEQQARGFSDFLLGMLRFDPELRTTAAEALCHEWLNTPIQEDPADFNAPSNNRSEPIRKFQI